MWRRPRFRWKCPRPERLVDKERVDEGFPVSKTQDCVVGSFQPSLRDWFVLSNPTQD
jgi:hypothetical protein